MGCKPSCFDNAPAAAAPVTTEIPGNPAPAHDSAASDSADAPAVITAPEPAGSAEPSPLIDGKMVHKSQNWFIARVLLSPC
jgi:hypothetical protein